MPGFIWETGWSTGLGSDCWAHSIILQAQLLFVPLTLYLWSSGWTCPSRRAEKQLLEAVCSCVFYKLDQDQDFLNCGNMPGSSQRPLSWILNCGGSGCYRNLPSYTRAAQTRLWWALESCDRAQHVDHEDLVQLPEDRDEGTSLNGLCSLGHCVLSSWRQACRKRGWLFKGEQPHRFPQIPEPFPHGLSSPSLD